MVEKLEERGRVIFNDEIAPRIYWLSATMPGIAKDALPGQFLQLRVESQPAVQFLRMPFAVYDANPSTGAVDVCYQIVGEGTEQLARVRPGELLSFVGPIGNGWNPPAGCRHALLACGGVGAPALAMLATELARDGVKVDSVMGATTEARLACTERFEAAAEASGGSFHVTTDDGTAGTKGFVNAVTDDLIRQGDYDYVAVCGPGPMERSVVVTALEQGVFCEASLERFMACGVGACLGCVVETASGLKRCCVDGPVFDASEVTW